MKTIIRLVIIACFLVGSLHAEFRTWTRNDGNSARLELIGKSGEGDSAKASFMMLSGKVVELTISDLIEADIKFIDEWEPGETVSSVFDDALDTNLVRLEGKSFKHYELEQRPTKYYLFYYTASWCPPCQRFTPSLVKFYDEYKPKSDEFEIILVTSDSDEGAMEDYAKSKKMNWPQLKRSKVDRFKKEFKHPGRGIPNLVLTDLQGKLLKTSYEGDRYVGPTVVMNHLEQLIK